MTISDAELYKWEANIDDDLIHDEDLDWSIMSVAKRLIAEVRKLRKEQIVMFGHTASFDTTVIDLRQHPDRDLISLLRRNDEMLKWFQVTFADKPVDGGKKFAYEQLRQENSKWLKESEEWEEKND